MKKIRVLVAYGRDIIREGLVCSLKKMPNVELVSVCEYAGKILSQAHKLMPDIVLLDGNIVGGDFLDVARQLRKELPMIRIIIITPLLRSYHDPLYYLNSKADGYIDLDIDVMRLSEAINNIYGGGTTICALIAEALINEEKTAKDSKANIIKQQFILTKRETEVLDLVAEGKINSEIAGLLSISENTVKAHLQGILRKMGVHSRTQAAILAREKMMIKG